MLCPEVLAGTDVYNKIMQALYDGVKVPDRGGMITIDMFGYDGWSAEAVIQQSIAKAVPKAVLGTICHNAEATKYVTEVACRVLYEACRKGDMEMEGFPKLSPILERLRKVSDDKRTTSRVQYQLCVNLSDGTLLIPNAMTSRWLSDPTYADSMKEILAEHNATFNPCNKKKRRVRCTSCGDSSHEKAKVGNCSRRRNLQR